MIIILCFSSIVALEMIDNFKEQISELIIEDEIFTDYQQYFSIEIWTYYAPMINYKEAQRDTNELQCNSILEIKTFDNHTLLMYNQSLDYPFHHQISLKPKEEEFQEKISFLQENYYSVWVLLKIDHRILNNQTSINIYNSKTQTNDLVLILDQRIFYNKYNYVILRKYNGKSGFFRGLINYKSQFNNNQGFGLIQNPQFMTYNCSHQDQSQRFFIEEMVCGQYSISFWFNIKSLQGKYKLIQFYASEFNLLQASITLQYNGNFNMKAKFLNYTYMEKFVDEIFINFDKWIHFQYIWCNNSVQIQMLQDQFKYQKKYDNIFFQTPASYLILVSDQQNIHSSIQVLNSQLNHDVIKFDDLITKSCHYSCLYCNGPFDYNCMDCITENNRYFNNNKCICKEGYIDIKLGPCYFPNSYIETKEIKLYNLLSYNQVEQDQEIQDNEKLIPLKFASNCAPNCQECDRQKCTKCNNDYYISIDGVNCISCQIQDCQICYQIDEVNQEYNTINFNNAQINENTQTHCALCDNGFVYNYQNQICQKQFYQQCLHYYDEFNKLTCFNYQNRADYDYLSYFSTLLLKRHSIQLDDSKFKQFLENNQQLLLIDNYDKCPNYCQTCSPRTQKQIYEYNPYFINSREESYQTQICDQLNQNLSSATYLKKYQIYQICENQDCIQSINFNMDCDRLCQINKYHLQNQMDLLYILNNYFFQINLNYTLVNSEQVIELQSQQIRNPKEFIFMIKEYNLLLDGSRFNIDYNYFNQEISGFNSIILQNFQSQLAINFNLTVTAIDGFSFTISDNFYSNNQSFNLKIINATQIDIQNLTIKCIGESGHKINFHGYSRVDTLKISIRQLTLRNCNLNDGSLIQFINYRKKTDIQIDNLNIIDCKLKNFSITQSLATTFDVVKLSLVNTIILNSILFQESSSITLSDINIINTKFYQSQILIINNNININKFLLSESYLDSPILINREEMNDAENLEILITISQSIIQYIQGKGFIQLKSSKFKVFLDDLDIKGIDSNNTFFNIQAEQLILTNSNFEKHTLTTEFNLTGLDYLKIDNVKLTGDYQSSFLQLTNIKLIDINNLKVQQLLQFRQPLIQYMFYLNYTSKFILANSIFKDNQIFIIDIDSQRSDTLMNFSNINQGEFYFTNLSFLHNTIKHPLAKLDKYGQTPWKSQQQNGGLFNFGSINSKIYIDQIIVQQFISIVLFFPSIVIQAQFLVINDSYFDKINLNFINQQGVINGGIIKTFIEKIYVRNCTFQDAMSNSGTALNIITKNEGVINITSSQFIRMKATFLLPFSSQGGSILINSRNSSLILILKDIYIYDSIAPEHGGFIYCQASNNSYVLLENINAFEVFSFMSSFLRFNSFNNQSSVIKLRNINIQNSQQGYDNLIKQLIFHPTTENNGIISIQAQIIKLTNFSFSGFSHDSVLDIKVLSKVVLSNVKIDQSQLFLSQAVCIKNEDENNAQIYVRINKLIIKNIEIKEYSLYQLKTYNRILLYQNNQDRILNSYIFHIGFNKNQIDFIAKDIILLNNLCILCKKGFINIENANNKSNYQFIGSMFINNSGIQQSIMYINGLLNIQMMDSLFLKNHNNSFSNPDLKFIKNIQYNYGNEYLSQVEFLELKPFILFIDQEQQYIQGNVNVMNSLKTVADFREKQQADSLKLVFNETMFKTEKLSNQEYKYEQTLVKPFKIYSTNYLQDFILLPTLSQNSYQYFDPQTQQYYSYDLNYIFVILDKTGNQAEINNTQILNIQTSIYDTDKNMNLQENNENFKLTYNEHLRGFQLNKLNFSFSPYNPSNLVYQLNIQCDCINNNYEHILRLRTFPCNPGEYYNNQVCKRCEDQFGRYSLVANSSICKVVNEFIDNNTNNQISLKKGYWRLNNVSNNIIECNQIIDKCNGGWSGGDKSCQIGYQGPLCEECDTINFSGQGYFYKKNEKCLICQNTSAWLIKFILLGIWILISTFITVKTTLAQNNQFLSYQILYKQYDILFRLNQDQSGSVMKIAINNLQIISTLQLMNIQSFYGYENPLNFLGNPIQMMGSNIECFLSKEFNLSQNIFQLILLSISPLFFITMFQASYLIYVYIFKISYQKHITIIATSSFYLFIYLQPDIMRELLSYLSFRSISGIYWVAGNLKYKYFSEQNINQVIYFIGPTSFLYVVTIPLLLLYLITKIKERLQDKQSRNKFSYLYNEYRNNSYFWEIFRIFQRQTIIIIIVVLSKVYLNFQIQLLTILMYIFVQKLQTLKPYNQGQLNQFEIRNKQLILLIFQTSSIIYSFEENANDQLLLICFILLMIFLILLLYYHIVKIIRSYKKFAISKLENLIDSIFYKFPKLKGSLSKIEKWQTNRLKRSKRLSLLNTELLQYLQVRGKLISKIKSNIETNQTVEKNYQNLVGFRDYEIITSRPQTARGELINL